MRAMARMIPVDPGTYGRGVAPQAGPLPADAHYSPATDIFVGKLILAAVILAIAIGVYLWRRRRTIFARLDDAAVGALASGVRAGRKASRAGASLRQRVLERADRS
jgi:hypothetical protein